MGPVADADQIAADLELDAVEPWVDVEGIFGVKQYYGAELAGIVLKIETSVLAGVFLYILEQRVVPANRSIGTQLDIGITFPANYHTISLPERNEVIYFRLLIVVLVNRVQHQVGFLEFGKLHQVVSLVVQTDRVRQFELA